MSDFPSPAKRRRGLVPAIVVLAALVVTTTAIPPPYADADTKPVVVVNTTVDNAWWVANALSLNSGPDLVRLAYYEQVLQTMYTNNPSLSATTAAKEIQKLESQVDARMNDYALGAATGDQMVPAFLAVIKEVVSSNVFAKATAEAAKQAFQYYSNKSVVDSPNGAQQLEASTDLAVMAQKYYLSAPTILSGAINRSRDPDQPYFRTAQNLIFGAQTAPTGAKAQQIIDNNPQLQILQGVNDLVRSNGQIKTNLAELKDLAQTEFARIEAQQAEAQQTLEGIAKGQKVVLDYVDHEREREAEMDAAKAKATREQQILSAETSGVFILSTLVGLADKKLGHDLQVVGTVAIQVANGVAKFSELAASMGSVLNAVGSLAGAALTGNIFSAAMALIPLFVNTGPTPEQQILDQVAQMRQQLADLGHHLDERFDAIDKNLSTIYNQMMTQFDKLDTRLGQIQGDVYDVQHSLVALHDQLVTLEGGVYSSISDGFRRDFWKDVEFALDYQIRNGDKTLPKADYSHADSDFYLWASRTAYDQVAVGPSDRPYDEARLLTELTKNPLDVNVDYLAQLPVIWGLPALSGAAVPNPHDWFLGSRAYLSLQQNNPTDAQGNGALHREVGDLISGGDRLQKLERAIAARPLSDHGQARLNPLFDTLFDRYDAKLAQTEAEIARVQVEYAHDLTLDPFGGIDQATPLPKDLATGRNKDFTSVKFCDGTGPALPLNDAAADGLVPAPLRIAQYYAHSGDTILCAKAHWSDFEEVVRGKVEITSAKLTTTVVSLWTYQGRTETMTKSVSNREHLCSVFTSNPNPEPCLTPDAGAFARGHWSAFQPGFDGPAQMASRIAYNDAAGAASKYLVDRQRDSYRRVADAFGGGRLHDAAEGLTGISTAIGDYVQLGMPGALSGDELLSAMLLGNQRILDQDDSKRLTGWFLDAAANPPASNAVNGLHTEATRREDALGRSVGRYLDVIQKGESAGSILTETTLHRLRLLEPTILTPAAYVSPAKVTHSLGTVRLKKHVDKTLLVNNPGVGVLQVKKVVVSGSGYSIVKNTCRTVPGHKTCTITVRFAPRKVGKQVGALTLTTNTDNPTRKTSLTAVGRR